MPTFEGFAKGAFATAAGVSTIGLGLLYYGQSFLIYPSAFPPGSRTEVPQPSVPFENLSVKTQDGIRIHCYLMTQKKELGIDRAPHVGYTDDESDEQFASARPTVMMFHGNGGNVGHRVPLARVFYVNMRCNVLMVSYRGYGLSEGSPSEKGLQMDAQAALDHLTSHPTLSKSPIILYGQSIGGAVSIDLASKNLSKITALILENTFLSIPLLIPHALPILSPFSFLCHQKWESHLKLPLVVGQGIPLLMLSGIEDEVVPREHMRRLWGVVAGRGTGIKRSWGWVGKEEVEGEVEVVGEKVRVGEAIGSMVGRSRYVEFPDGAHNDTCVQPGYWSAVAHFIASLGPSQSSNSEGKAPAEDEDD